MSKTKNNKPKKIKRLPKSPNGKRRKTTSFANWGYQKDELKSEARQKGVSVSYLLNMKMGFL